MSWIYFNRHHEAHFKTHCHVSSNASDSKCILAIEKYQLTKVFFFPVIIDKPGDPKYKVDCNCVKRTSVAVCEQAAFPLGPCDDPDESLCCVQKIVKRRWWPWG